MKKYYPQEHMKTSNKNVKEIAGYMIAFQKKKRERERNQGSERDQKTEKYNCRKKLEKAVEQKEKII